MPTEKLPKLITKEPCTIQLFTMLSLAGHVRDMPKMILAPVWEQLGAIYDQI